LKFASYTCHYFLYFIVLIYPFSTNSQNLYFTRKYYINPVQINPAITAADFQNKSLLLYDRQFIGISESPETYIISGQMRIGNYGFYDPEKFINKSKFESMERVGVGGGLYHDKDGPLSQIMVNISYAYHIPLNNGSQLSFGLSGNAYNYRLISEKFEPYHLNDPSLNIFSEPERKTNFNSTIGVFYDTKKWFIGTSFKDFIPLKNGLDSSNEPPINLYLYFGYKFFTPTEFFFIEPSVIVKKESFYEDLIVDINIKTIYNKYYWIGLSYRDFGIMNILMVAKIYKSIYFGYSYENAIRLVDDYNIGSHGVFLGTNLGHE